MELSLVLVTCPVGEIAEKLSEQLVFEGLAVCVNVLPGVTSTFKWQGQIQRESEALLIVKTKTDRLKRLENRIYEIHPYDTPEFIVLDPSMVGEKYLRWALLD